MGCLKFDSMEELNSARNIVKEIISKIKSFYQKFLSVSHDNGTSYDEEKIKGSRKISKKTKHKTHSIQNRSPERQLAIPSSAKNRIQRVQPSQSNQNNQTRFPPFELTLATKPGISTKGIQVFSDLSKDNLEVRMYSTISKKIDLWITEIHKNHRTPDKRRIGGTYTLLAMKNPKSYMIATWGKWIKVVENNESIYFGKLPEVLGSIQDIIYIRRLNCYIFNHCRKLYRKDVDRRHAYLFMNINCGCREGSSILYSEIHQKLIVAINFKDLGMIDLLRADIDTQVEKRVGDDIQDFKLFGRRKDKVACITANGWIVLYHFEYPQKTGFVVGLNKIDLLRGQRNEKALTLEVCDKGRHLIVEIGRNEDPYTCSRMLIFEIVKNELIQKSVLDPSPETIGQKDALKCIGFFGKTILWVGLSWREGRVLQVYEYEIFENRLRELEDFRQCHQEDSPVKMVRLGNQFFYTGYLGKVMKIDFRVKNYK